MWFFQFQIKFVVGMTNNSKVLHTHSMVVWLQAVEVFSSTHCKYAVFFVRIEIPNAHKPLYGSGTLFLQCQFRWYENYMGMEMLWPNRKWQIIHIILWLKFKTQAWEILSPLLKRPINMVIKVPFFQSKPQQNLKNLTSLDKIWQNIWPQNFVKFFWNRWITPRSTQGGPY